MSFRFISKIAFRNISRQKRRSILTGLTMAGGFILLSLAISLSEGTYGNAIDLFTRSHTGHIQIHKEGYRDRATLHNAFEGLEEIPRGIESVKGISSWAPRIYASAMIFNENKTSVARIVGIDPLLESKTTSIKRQVQAGTYIPNEPSNEIMLAQGLAQILNSKLGDEIVLVTQGADGSIANDIFKVSAIMKGTKSSFDRNNCYLHISTAQRYLAMENKYHEIAVVVKNYREAVKRAQDLKTVFGKTSMEIEPWQEIQKHFYDAMTADKKGMWYALTIIIVIVGIGVLNTVLMAVLERTKEFGMLKALGTRPLDIFAMIILETVYLSLISIILAFIASYLINSVLSVTGIPYPRAVHVGGFEITHMIGTTVPVTYVYPILITFMTAFFVSIFPATRAMKILPMDAMRTD